MIVRHTQNQRFLTREQARITHENGSAPASHWSRRTRSCSRSPYRAPHRRSRSIAISSGAIAGSSSPILADCRDKIVPGPIKNGNRSPPAPPSPRSNDRSATSFEEIFGITSPNTRRAASTSTRSPACVDVPCAFIYCTLRSPSVRERQLHASLRPLAAGRDHIVSVRRRTIPRDLGIDPRTAGFCMLQFLEHHHSPPRPRSRTRLASRRKASTPPAACRCISRSSPPSRRTDSSASSPAPRRRRQRPRPACPTGSAPRRCRCNARSSSRPR